MNILPYRENECLLRNEMSKLKQDLLVWLCCYRLAVGVGVGVVVDVIQSIETSRRMTTVAITAEVCPYYL